MRRIEDGTIQEPTVPASSFYVLSDRAHALGASTAVLSCYLIWGKGAALWSAAVVFLWSILKEAVWDNLFESEIVRGSGLRDAFCYWLGISFALALIWTR